MIYELFGWFEGSSKKKLKEEDLKKIFRKARRRYVVKHGKSPGVLMVRKDEYKKWMSGMGIDIRQVDKDLAPKHFMLMPASRERLPQEVTI